MQSLSRSQFNQYVEITTSTKVNLHHLVTVVNLCTLVVVVTCKDSEQLNLFIEMLFQQHVHVVPSSIFVKFPQLLCFIFWMIM